MISFRSECSQQKQNRKTLETSDNQRQNVGNDSLSAEVIVHGSRSLPVQHNVGASKNNF